MPGRAGSEREQGKDALGSALRRPGLAKQRLRGGREGGEKRNGESTPSGIRCYYGPGIIALSAKPTGQRGVLVALRRHGCQDEEQGRRRWRRERSQHLLLDSTTAPLELPGSINYTALSTHSIRINRNK